MNNGILDIHASVASDYLKILNGTYMLSSKAPAVRSENCEIEPCEDDKKEETVSAASPEPVQKYISVIPIKGPIQREDLLNRNNEVAYWGMDYVAYQIDACTNDPNNRAIVIDMSTGGGYSNAVASVISAIQAYKKTGRDVIMSVDMACSAGLHIAVWGTKIYANSRSSILGCVGTKWEGIKEIGEAKFGYKRVVVTSDQTPDKGREFDEALQGNPRLLKDHIMTDIAQHFIDDVKTNRKVDPIAIKGSTYAAEKAMKMGFCDGIMPLNEILSNLKKGQAPSVPSNSSTPKNTSNFKIQNNTMEKFNFFSWISLKNSGETTPQMDGEAMQDYSRLQNLEASFDAEKSGFQNQITGLENSLAEEKRLKNEALQEVESLKARLDKTPGAAATQPVSGKTGESTTTTPVDGDEVPEVQSEMSDFFTRVKSQQARNISFK